MNRIKELRLEKFLTQSELGKVVGVNHSAVGKYEREELEPNISTLHKLADFFGCSIDYLVGREDDFGNVQRSSPGLTADEQQLLRNFALLGPFERETILIQINALAKEKGVIKK